MSNQDLTIDRFDPRFEQPWKNSADLEQRLIEEVSEVIRSFVRRSSQTRQTWRRHQIELENAEASGDKISRDDRERLARYRDLFGDLPERHNAQFATRDVHRKTHGCFKAVVTVNEDFDPAFSKGLFQPGRTFDAVVRFSNGNPRNRHDMAPDARGMAIKLLEAGTLPRDSALDALDPHEMNEHGLLDLLTINFPVFFVDDPEVYARVNRHFLTDDPDILKGRKRDEILSVAVGGMSPLEQNLALKVNGSIIHNLLFQQWFSMAPSRLGDLEDPRRTAVKYLIEPAQGVKGDPDWPDWSTWEHGRNYQVPLSDRLNIPKPAREDMEADADFLRTRLGETLARGDFEMTLKLQPFISHEATPIEDTTRIWHWSEDEIDAWLGDLLSLPFVSRRREAGRRDWHAAIPAATIRITGEAGAASNSIFCEDLSFNPWNNVPAAHKPLGITQRVKRFAYEASRRTRFEINATPDPFPPIG